MKERCVNIDWLEVYVIESASHYPCDADFFTRQGYFVHPREYGTRVYREMFSLDDEHGNPWIEIRRNPFSTTARNNGFFSPYSCHVRLANCACYELNAISKLRDFLAKYDYQFQKIYRLDICLDFVTFDRGDDPNRFLQRFIAGRYSKINQANITVHGSDMWAGRLWNSVSWGNPKSMVSTKMYCKTKELAEVRDKPYIRWSWFLSQLIDDPVSCTKRNEDGQLEKVDVWRVEFSIKSSANRWFLIEKSTGKRGNIPMPHSLDMYDTKEKLLTAFASLAQHYFKFKVYEADKRKDRCKDKVLFDFSPLDTFYQIDRLASHTANAKPEERLIAHLRAFALTHPVAQVKEAVSVLITELERIILHKYSNPMLTSLDILALQRLIADRSRGIRDESITKQLEDLKQSLANIPNIF